MTDNQAWKRMTATAMVGTAIQSYPAESLSPEWKEFLPESGTPESAFLTLVAGASLMRRAGYAPAVDQENAKSAPEDSLLPGPDSWDAFLRTCLEEEASLVTEWLQLVAESGRLAPFRCLPVLLEHGTNHRDRRPLVRRVGGQRLRWLAGHRPEWSWATHAPTREGTEPDKAIWNDGQKAERTEYFRALRTHDPAAARSLLAETFKSEPAAMRVSLIECLDIGLDSADEGFLEACLADRRKQVSRRAAQFLSALPGSAFAGRMGERAGAIAGAKSGLLGIGKRLVIEPPEELTPEMESDTIGADSPQSGQGKRAGWLADIVAFTPLRVWSEDFGLEPADAIKQVDKSSWRNVMLDGWLRAAAQQRNAAWMQALTMADGPRKTWLSELGPALERLSPDDLATVISALIDRGQKKSADISQALPAWLRQLPGPWPLGLTEKILAMVANPKAFQMAMSNDWSFREVAGQVALKGHPAGWPIVEQRLDAVIRSGSYPPSADKFFARYQFRYSMHQEIQP
ncbi:MAG: DUF5691 domain-containing protein [Sumerlaeia bacterium]